MYLSENIRYLRLRKGFSQEYVANMLGYKSFTTIQKWESGVSEPPIKKLQELSKLFDVDIDDMTKKQLSFEYEKAPHIPDIHSNSLEGTLFLSDKEEKLIADFRELNSQGQDYILQTMDLVKDKYKKCDSVSELENLG